MTTEARIALLVFAVLYTAWAIWVSRLTLTRRTIGKSPDPHLNNAARKYRLMSHVRVAMRGSIALFIWGFVVLAPTSTAITILLALPIMLVALAMVILPLVWRHDLRRLHDSGLVP